MDICVLAIDENPIQNVEIYPNPTNRFFTAKTEMSIEKLNIYNALGIVVKEFYEPKSQYDISGLSSGIYILEIKTEKGFVFTKLLKN